MNNNRTSCEHLRPYCGLTVAYRYPVLIIGRTCTKPDLMVCNPTLAHPLATSQRSTHAPKHQSTSA